MPLNSPLVLATGATGRLAGLVVPQLVARGARIRALIRDARDGAAVRARGAAEVSVADFADPGSMEAALAGVERLFLISPAFMPDEAAVTCRVVDIAKRMGVRRIVYSSAIHSRLTTLVNHRAKALVEEHLIGSDLEFVVLQPTLVYQNYAPALSVAARTGTFSEPYANASRMSRVDYRDVAEVAAIALCEDRLTFGTFELCADGHLNRHEVAALMGQALGRAVTACCISPADWLARSGLSADSPQARGLTAMFAWYDRHGLHGNATALRALLGREPRTLLSYFRELFGAAPP